MSMRTRCSGSAKTCYNHTTQSPSPPLLSPPCLLLFPLLLLRLLGQPLLPRLLSVDPAATTHHLIRTPPLPPLRLRPRPRPRPLLAPLPHRRILILMEMGAVRLVLKLHPHHNDIGKLLLRSSVVILSITYPPSTTHSHCRRNNCNIRNCNCCNGY